MKQELHHITKQYLQNYLEEAERLMESEEGVTIINIPVALKMENGKYVITTTPSFKQIVDCVNEDFEDTMEVQLIGHIK